MFVNSNSFFYFTILDTIYQVQALRTIYRTEYIYSKKPDKRMLYLVSFIFVATIVPSAAIIAEA